MFDELWFNPNRVVAFVGVLSAVVEDVQFKVAILTESINTQRPPENSLKKVQRPDPCRVVQAWRYLHYLD